MKTSQEWISELNLSPMTALAIIKYLHQQFPATKGNIKLSEMITDLELERGKVNRVDLEMLIIKVQRDAIESAHKLAQQVISNTLDERNAVKNTQWLPSGSDQAERATDDEDDDSPKNAEDLALDIADHKGDVEREDLK